MTSALVCTCCTGGVQENGAIELVVLQSAKFSCTPRGVQENCAIG